jgi:REP element-mobilizing transposase RayT
MLQIYFNHDSMPRSARFVQPGLLQHVIVRGIEKRDIFFGDEDRDDFVRRLSTLLLETETECLGWVLMTNHVHLLLRTKGVKLARLKEKRGRFYFLAKYFVHSVSEGKNRFRSSRRLRAEKGGTTCFWSLDGLSSSFGFFGLV